MLRQNVEHTQSVFDPAPGSDAGSEHYLFAAVVDAWTEREPHIAARADGPTREASGDFDHVFLRVSAVNSERVQFHDLASVIFVQSRTARLRQRVAIGVELLRRRRLLQLA